MQQAASPRTDREIVEEGAAANDGAVGNLLLNIRAIRDGEAPPRPSNARLALGAARSFLKQHRFKLSPATTDHVENVIETLEAVVQSPGAQEQEEGGRAVQSAELEEVLESSGGVYAYTYPHYWRHPTVEGTRRTLLKVGMTTRDAKVRIPRATAGNWYTGAAAGRSCVLRRRGPPGGQAEVPRVAYGGRPHTARRCG